jgi:hypothetical protein
MPIKIIRFRKALPFKLQKLRKFVNKEPLDKVYCRVFIVDFE